MRTPLTTAVTACAGAVLLAACGAPPQPSPASTTPSPPSRAGIPSPTGNPAAGQVTGAENAAVACTSADLAVSPGPDQGHSGTHKSDATFTLTNTGARSCTLKGFPGVSFVTGDNGTPVGAPARRDDVPPQLVTLAPGAGASTILLITDPDAYDQAECEPVDVRGLRIHPPGETAALFLDGATRTCGATPHGDSLLSVGPVGVTQ